VIQPLCEICSLILEVDDFSIGYTLNFVSQLCGYDFLNSQWNTWSSIKCGINVCGTGYSCNLVNCSSYPLFVDFYLQNAVNPYI